MVRRLGLITVLLMAAAPAQAQTLDDIIGTWTRLRAIGMYCPKFYRVDIEYLSKLQSVFEDVGSTKFPGEVSETRIRQAGARRDAEVKKAGAKQWCTKWRTAMRRDGTGQIWP